MQSLANQQRVKNSSCTGGDQEVKKYIKCNVIGAIEMETI
jgi:hypothetical protein